MNTPFDSDTSAVEKLLHDRTRQAPPPALRTRVLAAVDEVLPKKVTVTTLDATWVPVTFFMATVLLLLIIATLPSEAASRRIGGMTDQPLLSFAQRAEAAGISLDVMPPSTVQLAGGLPQDTAIPRHRDTFHVLATRSFLQGDL